MSKHSPGELPVELHSHKDDNFKRKPSAREVGGPSLLSCLFLIFLVVVLEDRCVAARYSVPCNRTRQVLTEEHGSIEDGPKSSNYTGETRRTWRGVIVVGFRKQSL